MLKYLRSFLSQFRYQENTDVTNLDDLSEDILNIVIEDGEKLIAAQLQGHLSSNQRGFALSSINLTVATAISGAYLALKKIDVEINEWPIFLLLIGFLIASALSAYSTKPTAFCFPGNDPKNWLPNTWPKGKKRTVKTAKIEKLRILQSQLQKNRTTAFRKAMTQYASLVVSAGITLIFAVLSF